MLDTSLQGWKKPLRSLPDPNQKPQHTAVFRMKLSLLILIFPRLCLTLSPNCQFSSSLHITSLSLLVSYLHFMSFSFLRFHVSSKPAS